MIEKRFLGNPKGAKVGGGMRRKMVAGSRPTDQSRISATLKRFNFTELNNILEVNIFVRNQSDETDVIHITEPKVLVSQSNFTAQVTGRVEINQVSHYFPYIIDQLGPDLRERMNVQEPEPQQEPSMGGRSGMGSMGGMGGMGGKDEDDSEDDMPGLDDDDDDDDDGIPELAGNFDVDD